MNTSTRTEITTPSTASVTRFWEKSLLALWAFFCPKRKAMMVEVPTAKITAMENRRLIKGTDRLTALMAYSPTPRATNRPSTMEYREKTMREATVAVEKWINCFNKLCCCCILDEIPFLSAAHRVSIFLKIV